MSLSKQDALEIIMDTLNDMSTISFMASDINKQQEPVDNVDNPAHYKSGDIECIDAIKAALTPEEYRGYLKGNVIKYTWRERLKGGSESIAKAGWYIKRLLGNV